MQQPQKLIILIKTQIKVRRRVSSWCNGQSAGLRNRGKRVRTPVVLLCSLSDKYEPPHPPRLNSTATVLLEGWLWH